MVSKSKDIVKWYEEIIISSEIASPGLVKGTLFIYPRGWNIWERIWSFVDEKYSEIGIKNVSFSSLIPYSEIEKEKENLTGFLPELFLVSKSSDPEKKTNVFLRPTSEILFSHFFKKKLNSYSQLPFLFNQWCNVYRSEKNTRAFLRNCEFYWQEAHTLHRDKDESQRYLNHFHQIYKDLIVNFLNIAILEGEKTVNERFKGAENTLAIEAIMPDGQALQIATSHYLAQNFSKIFDIKYTNSKNELEYPHQLSAGTSTRLIGALILSHSDDNGLVLPFGVAESQIKILVINDSVKKDSDLHTKLSSALSKYRIEWDFSDKTFGYKMKSEELAGTPFVVVIGPKELSEGRFLVKSRISDSKMLLTLEEIILYFEKAPEEYSKTLYESSLKNLKDSIRRVNNLEEAKEEVLKNKKIVLVPWFDDGENELNFSNEKLGFGPRCIESRVEDANEKCFYSGKKATVYAYFGRSY